jgi:acetyl-CoA carboxylase biotin carboxyl carrier protein
MTLLQREMLTEKKSGACLLLSPSPGLYSLAPAPMQVLSAGNTGGRLKILNHFYDLVVPAGIQGMVTRLYSTERVVKVDYRHPLFELKHKDLSRIQTTGRKKSGDPGPELNPADERVITAFTTGIFYARPSPDAPPFVEEGQQIEKGKALGLIEVMKTFNHIVFQGIGTSHRGVVRRILVDDTQEVNLGEPLFIIDPVLSGGKKKKS